MKFAIKLFKKNLSKILNNKYRLKKQLLSNGSYYNKASVNYKKKLKINTKNFSIKTHNKIRSLIFPAYQYPFVNGVKIVKSVYRNKKIYLTQPSDYKFK